MNTNWQRYEAMKRAWIKANPGATAAQYDASNRSHRQAVRGVI